MNTEAKNTTITASTEKKRAARPIGYGTVPDEAQIQLKKFTELFYTPAAHQAEALGLERTDVYMALSLVGKKGYETRFCPVYVGGADYPSTVAWAWISNRAKGYFNVGYRGGSYGKGKRGTSQQVVGIPGLWFDMDIAAAQHVEKRLPTSLDEALELIQLALPNHPPTHLVFSGYGVHAYWLFDKPWFFQTEAEWSRGQAQLRGLSASIRKVATSKGYKLDNVSDLARCLRVPGTYNMKDPENPKLVHFIHESDHRYTPAEFDFLVGELSQPRAPRNSDKSEKLNGEQDVPAGQDSTPKSTRHSRQNEEKDWALGNFERIYEECRFIRHWADDAAGLLEPEWFAGISIVVRCLNGDELAHGYSSRDPRYSEAETEAKIEHAIANAGPRTCRNIRDELGFEGCVQCVYRRHITSPIQLGALS